MRKALLTFGLIFILLSLGMNAPVIAQAEYDPTGCARWMKLIDPSAGLLS